MHIVYQKFHLSWCCEIIKKEKISDIANVIIKKRELSIFRKIIPQFFYLMNEQTDFENISLPLR